MNVTLILDNIRSAHNIGQALRLADAVGVDKVYLCGITPYPDMGNKDTRRYGVKEKADKEIRKTALSAYDCVNWEYRENVIELVKELKESENFVTTVELTPESKLYTKVEYKYPLVLIFGHEREGVNPELIKLSDEVVQLPMLGVGKSLNVTNSMSAVLYELVRLNS